MSSLSSPSEFRRVLWLYTGMAVVILSIGPSDLLSLTWWQSQHPRDLWAVLLPVGAGLLLGLLCSRDIWRLSVQKGPLWKDVITGLIVLIGLAGMIFLRESGLWVWSFAAGDAFVVSLTLTIVVVALVTERKKQVRVYLATRNWFFVHENKDA